MGSNEQNKPLPRRPGNLQARARGATDKQWYAPHRDITVLFPKLIRQTFHELSNNQDPAVEEVWSALGITDAEMKKMVETFASIVNCVIKRGEDLREAMERSGFCSHRAQAVLGMIFMRLTLEEFLGVYGQILHVGEPDENLGNLKECAAKLAFFGKHE